MLNEVMGLEKQKISVSAVLLVAFFLIGVFAGCFVSLRVSSETSDYLNGYISGIVRGEDVMLNPIGQAILNSLSLPVVIFILSFTVFGVAAIPLAVATKAFFLSFAIAAFVRSFGVSGALYAFGALGPQNLLSLPCLFILSAQGIASSLAVVSVFVGKSKKPGGFYGKPALVKALVCSLVLLAAALLEAYVVPSLFSALAVNI